MKDQRCSDKIRANIQFNIKYNTITFSYIQVARGKIHLHSQQVTRNTFQPSNENSLCRINVYSFCCVVFFFIIILLHLIRTSGCDLYLVACAPILNYLHLIRKIHFIQEHHSEPQNPNNLICLILFKRPIFHIVHWNYFFLSFHLFVSPVFFYFLSLLIQ